MFLYYYVIVSVPADSLCDCGCGSVWAWMFVDATFVTLPPSLVHSTGSGSEKNALKSWWLRESTRKPLKGLLQCSSVSPPASSSSLGSSFYENWPFPAASAAGGGLMTTAVQS